MKHRSFYSQFGEDKIIFEIFQRKTVGVCVEVGANNGIDDSTSLFFEKIGWKCILVEPNPDLCQTIRKARAALLYEYAASNESNTRTLHVVEGRERSDGLSTISNSKEVHDRIRSHGLVSTSVEVRTTTLDNILIDAHIGSEIDFISIDVEGHEHEVLQGFSLNKWKPFIILIEDNSNFEDSTVKNYLNEFGYVRFKRTGVNDWYTHHTNSQLVNTSSRIRLKWAEMGWKAKNRILRSRIRVNWIAVKKRAKDRLRKIPVIVKIWNLVRSKGVR